MTKRIALTAIATLLLSACNTISGMGRDIESVGDTIEDSAT